MTKLDDTLVPKISSLVDILGIDVTLYAPSSAPAYNPDTGYVIEPSPTTYALKATPPSPFNYKYIDGDVVKDGDASMTIAAKDMVAAVIAAMRPGSKFDFKNQSWIVQSVKKLYSGESICAYDLHLRPRNVE